MPPVKGFDYKRNYADFEALMRAALRGPDAHCPIITYDRDEKDDDSHGFVVRRAKISRQGDRYIIDGGYRDNGKHVAAMRLTHVRKSYDDEIRYRVVIDRKSYSAQVDWDIKGGGLEPLTKALSKGAKRIFDYCKKNPAKCAEVAKQLGTAVAGRAAAGPDNQPEGNAPIQEVVLDRAAVKPNPYPYRPVIELYEELLIVPKDQWQGAAHFLIACIAHLAVVEGESSRILVD